MRVLLFILLSSFSISVMADKDTVLVPLEIPCFPIKTLLSSLKDKYGEEPMLIGESSQERGVTTAVFVSQEAGTYTIVEMGEGVGCVLSTGDKVKYRFPKSLGKSVM